MISTADLPSNVIDVSHAVNQVISTSGVLPSVKDVSHVRNDTTLVL